MMGRRRPRVLHIDDMARERDLFAGFARTLGWQIEQACNGREALPAIEASRWDLIISDVRMPGMDGLRLANEIRIRPSPNVETPLVLATSRVTGEIVNQAKILGVRQVIAKPILLCTLRRLEEQILDECGCSTV